MDIDREKEDIKARIDLADLCRELGLEPNAKGRVAHCPAHNDQGRPNLTIYEKNVHCFACGFNGDAFDLVAKVKGLDFEGSFDFLAARLGLPLIQDYRKSGKGRGLGNGAGGKSPQIYPKAAPLPDSPSPTLGAKVKRSLSDDEVIAVMDRLTAKPEGLGNEAGGKGPEAYPKPPNMHPVAAYAGLWRDDDPRPHLPPDLWRADFETSVEANDYAADLVDRYRVVTGRMSDGRYGVCGFVWRELPPANWEPTPIPAPAPAQSLRVQVFTALLGMTTPASQTAAGEWLHREKGIAPATQDDFGLGWLDDPEEAEKELRRLFGEETLLRFGILGKTKDKKTGSERIYFGFYRHRLLFPFFWRGEPVDVQGRDINAKDKQGRFRNTGGKNPIPYNAGDLVLAESTGATLFICEGATDTLAVAQSGRLVVGIVGTGGFKREWLPHFKGLKVCFAFDNDDAGRKAATDYTRLFVDAGLPAPKVIRLPEGVKDVNEFFRRETAK